MGQRRRMRWSAMERRSRGGGGRWSPNTVDDDGVVLARGETSSDLLFEYIYGTAAAATAAA